MSRSWHAARACLLLACAAGCAHSSTPSARSPLAAAARDATPAALAEHGLALLARGDYLRAEQYLQLALRAGHDEAPLIVPLLSSCIASSRFRTALMHAERHLARHERAWRVRFVKAAIHRALDQPEPARLELQRALSDAPTEAHAALAGAGR